MSSRSFDEKTIHFIIASNYFTPKIIDKIRLFEDRPSLIITIYSIFRIVVNSKTKEYNYNLYSLVKVMGKLNIEMVYYHYLSKLSIYFSNYIKGDFKKAWMLWGGEFYNDSSQIQNFALPETLSYLQAKRVSHLKNIYQSILFNSNQTYVSEFARDIDFFIGRIEEYKLIKQAWNLNAKFIRKEFYLSIKDIKTSISSTENQDTSTQPIKILVGHSDEILNNHLDALSLLQEKQINQKLLIPIAGMNETLKYRIKEIIKVNNWDADLLESNLDPNVFFSLLNECSHVIYPSLRQLGQASLYPLISEGKTIFMNPQNPLFETCKRYGLHICEISELSKTKMNQTLSKEEKAENKIVMQNVLSVNKDSKEWNLLLNHLIN